MADKLKKFCGSVPGKIVSAVIYLIMLALVMIFFTGEEAPIGMGTIHIKGATDGAKTVTLRSTASTSQAKVTALKTGTVVNVYEKTGDWYAVESDGWYGYVQAQYLTME